MANNKSWHHAVLRVVLLWLSFPVLSARAQAPSPTSFEKFLNELALQGEEKVARIAPVFLKTFGLGIDHRAYSAAATPNIEVGIEATLFKVPDNLFSTLSEAGINVGSSDVKSLPSPKVHFLKSFSRSFSIGASALFYQGYWMGGGHLQFLIFDPPEGYQWALRFTYNRSELDYVSSATYGAYVVTSRRLAFAEPYLVFGGHMTRGSVSVNLTPEEATNQGLTLPPQYAQGLFITKTANVSSLLAAMGVGFWFGPTGLKLTLEGAYDSQKMHSLGVKVSLAF